MLKLISLAPFVSVAVKLKIIALVLPITGSLAAIASTHEIVGFEFGTVVAVTFKLHRMFR